MTPLEQYDNLVLSGQIHPDDWQRHVLASLEVRLPALSAPRFLQRFKKRVKGAYIYGPVGIGKTFLMDAFFEAVPISHKVRMHFHAFMQEVDALLRKRQGEKNPIQKIAKAFSQKTRLFCFDELMVEDTVHALMLRELFCALFQNGVMLVATSNTAPDALYQNGLHRERFLPAIALIKDHCELFSPAHDIHDHRKDAVAMHQKTYWSPCNKTANDALEVLFRAMVATPKTGEILIQKRNISVVAYGERAIWFQFSEICKPPRSQLDYLEIAERFDSIFVTDIPKLSEKDGFHAILLMRFVDVMYDQGVRLFLTAEVPPEELYTAGEWVNSFQRTSSRLIEMQSATYLLRHPRRRDLSPNKNDSRFHL